VEIICNFASDLIVRNIQMSQLIGEYQCRMDDKGRIRLPTALLRQLGERPNYDFVINRGLDSCLSLYPKNVWDKIARKVNQLNTFEKKKRDFVRYFFRGATELFTDSSERVLLPKSLLEYAGIQKDIVLAAHSDYIEVWDADRYNNLIIEDSDIYSDLAEQVMGDNHE
jgi:MraZ protein